jgi:hypothetical protein
VLIATTKTQFSTAHIGGTAALVGLLAIPVGYWLLRPRTPINLGLPCVIAALATFGERLCANMTQLNNDGVPSLSANDLLAPALTYILLSIYADLRPPANPRQFGQFRAAVTGIALAVNVFTI